jgi:hypothetical protein
MQDLLVLSHEDYTQLRCELKTAGLDLCYTVQSVRPIHMRWSPERVYDEALLQQVTRRRPADPSYRLASVHCTRPGNWFWPDRLTVTFHAVGATQDRALQDYLATPLMRRQVQSSRESVIGAQVHTTPRVASIVRCATTPLVAGVAFNVTPAVWHLPGLYEWALRNRTVHNVEHLSLLSTALLLWWPIVSPVSQCPRLASGP